MNGKQLKNSILQWAIQGKLVPQDPHDEPASVLLKKIRKEKERLIKEKKIKRDKNASIIYRGTDNSYYEKILATGEVKCIDEEVPFEIPKGWEWCRLRDIIQLLSGRDLEPSKYSTSQKGIPYITGASNFDKENLIINRWTQNPVTISEKGDLLITCKGTIGSMAFNNIGSIHIARQIMAIKSDCVNLHYLKLYLELNLAVLESQANSMIPGISRDIILNCVVPIPPIEEENRIVEKVYILMPFVNKYSSSQKELFALNKMINGTLRKSFLQDAIQGKLVPQIAEEGTAQELLEQIKAEKRKLVKEGKLKKSALNDSVIFRGDDNKYYEKIGKSVQCIAEEIPFEIPVNWAWVRLDDICSFIHRGKSPKYSLIKKYPVVAQKCNQWSGFSLEKAKFIEPQSISSYKEEYILQDDDLMWNSTGLGTLGRMAIYYKKLNPYKLAVADSHVTVIRPYKQHIVSEYLYYYFASNTVQSVIEDKSDGSTKQKELSTKTVKSYLVPLPPMEEQKRIVEKVKELMQLLK